MRREIIQPIFYLWNALVSSYGRFIIIIVVVTAKLVCGNKGDSHSVHHRILTPISRNSMTNQVAVEPSFLKEPDFYKQSGAAQYNSNDTDEHTLLACCVGSVDEILPPTENYTSGDYRPSTFDTVEVTLDYQTDTRRYRDKEDGETYDVCCKLPNSHNSIAEDLDFDNSKKPDIRSGATTTYKCYCKLYNNTSIKCVLRGFCRVTRLRVDTKSYPLIYPCKHNFRYRATAAMTATTTAATTTAATATAAVTATPTATVACAYKVVRCGDQNSKESQKMNSTLLQNGLYGYIFVHPSIPLYKQSLPMVKMSMSTNPPELYSPAGMAVLGGILICTALLFVALNEIKVEELPNDESLNEPYEIETTEHYNDVPITLQSLHLPLVNYADDVWQFSQPLVVGPSVRYDFVTTTRDENILSHSRSLAVDSYNGKIIDSPSNVDFARLKARRASLRLMKLRDIIERYQLRIVHTPAELQTQAKHQDNNTLLNSSCLPSDLYKNHLKATTADDVTTIYDDMSKSDTDMTIRKDNNNNNNNLTLLSILSSYKISRIIELIIERQRTRSHPHYSTCYLNASDSDFPYNRQSLTRRQSPLHNNDVAVDSRSPFIRSKTYQPHQLTTRYDSLDDYSNVMKHIPHSSRSARSTIIPNNINGIRNNKMKYLDVPRINVADPRYDCGITNIDNSPVQSNSISRSNSEDYNCDVGGGVSPKSTITGHSYTYDDYTPSNNKCQIASYSSRDINRCYSEGSLIEIRRPLHKYSRHCCTDSLPKRYTSSKRSTARLIRKGDHYNSKGAYQQKIETTHFDDITTDNYTAIINNKRDDVGEYFDGNNITQRYNEETLRYDLQHHYTDYSHTTPVLISHDDHAAWSPSESEVCLRSPEVGFRKCLSIEQKELLTIRPTP